MDIGGAIRWGALLLVLLEIALARPSHPEVEAAALLVAFMTMRVFVLSKERTPHLTLLEPLMAAVVCIVAISLSGGYGSPFVLNLGAEVLTGGLELGATAVLATIGSAVLAIICWTAVDPRSLVVRLAVERVAALVAAGGAGAYGRSLRAQAGQQTNELVRLRSAHEVNRLLLELHVQTATHRTSLSLPGALGQTISLLRSLLDPSLFVLLLKESTTEEAAPTWQAAIVEGVPLAATLSDSDLAPALAASIRATKLVFRAHLDPGEGIGPLSTSGLYAPLLTGGLLTGVLAVERARSPEFTSADAALLSEVATDASLAIDNARLFRRLRLLGAEDERGRVARELHDRLGQSLAATSIALDRLAAETRTLSEATGRGLHRELTTLAEDVRTANRQVREQLTDLRADTSEEVDLAEALSDLLSRVEARSGVRTELVLDAPRRLTPVSEHEVWQVAREAIINAERHARATLITVRWYQNASEAVLEVIDDGTGIVAAGSRRRDAYGIVGMRERADAIGASLAIVSSPEDGTAVRLRIVDVSR